MFDNIADQFFDWLFSVKSIYFESGRNGISCETPTKGALGDWFKGIASHAKSLRPAEPAVH